MAFRRLLAVLILGVVLGSFAPSARLEAGERARDIGAVLDVMPGMDEQFETVDELIEDEEWDRLLQKLSQIVDEAGDSVWAPKDRRVYISIRDYVRRLIMSLPAAGLANYRARYDAEAAGLYERGRQARAIAYLDAVDRRFPASSYAAPALDAAASLLMDGGRYGAAAGRLERLVNRPAMAGATASEKQVKRMALAKLAFCRAKLGDMDGAASAIRRLKKAASPGELRLAGGELSPQAYIRRELERGPAPVAGIRAKDDWPSPGGHLDHRPPMLDIRSDLLQWWWKKIGDESKPKKTPNRHVTSAIQIRYYAGAYGPLQMEAAPIPVTDREGVVYVNTGKGVFAIDHITGRLRWVTRPGSAPAASGQPVNRYNYAGQALAALWHRWQGATTASHGEGKVFAVEMLGSGYPLCLALTAFDASSGERLWSFEQGPDGVGFEGQAYFPWAPKYVDGRVVGLACFRDQMHLCALDAATGEVAWKTFLAADPVPTYNYRRPMFLRRLGQPVVIADGVAYAATGMGAVAAVDVGSGELYWISKYKRTAIQVKSTGSKFRRQTQYSYEGGWKAGFPVVSGGKLYVAPWDAKELLVFDARSGELSRKVRRGEFTHFAGVHRGSLILSGEGDTAAVDPHTGHLRWLVPTGVKPSGVPILTESAVVVPGERKLAVVKLGESPVVRELQSAKRRPEFPSKLGLGNVVSCSGRLVTANPAYVSGFFSYEKTRAEVTRLVEEHPARAKPLLDRADVSSLGGDRELEDNHRDAARRRYQQALADLQAAERIIGRQASTDSSLVSRHRRMMFETRLKLSETDPSNAVTHIDAARPYIYNPVARARFHLARGAALATAKRYQDAVDEYIHVIGNLADTKLRRGESRVPVGVLAQDRIGRLVEKYGGRVYARVDRRLKPRFDRLVREKDPEELRELQVKHPHSSLADNCLLEMARIVSKREHGALRSQTLLRSLTLRYPESEVLGEAYGMLLRNCLKSTQYRLAAVVLEDIAKKHPKIEVPWDGGTLTGEGLVARLMETEELKRASVALARALPVLVPPLGRVWEEGSDKEVLAQVVSDENCFDRGIGLAVRAVEGKGRWAAYGRITALRAFHTSNGKTLWKTKVDVDWCCGEYETGFSLWGRNHFRAIVVCSGSVVGLCHPEGILAFDLATGKRLWSRKWKRPATRQPNQWFDHTALRGVHSYLRQSMNQRPVFAAEAGRIFYYLPDGELGCLEAATGRDIWKASRGGYASGPIGLFGETVVVGTIQPNRISAYNILTGRKQYSKNVAGQYPSMPAYDRTRGRVFTSDGQRLYCRRVRDYKLLWRGGSTSQTHPRPWQVDVLPDGNVAATKYMRHGNQYGYGLVLYDGESGKLAWKVAVNRYKRKGRDYERVNMHGAPMFGRGLVFIRAQEYIRKREGKRYIQKRRMLMDIVDYRTGKKLRRYTAEAPKRKNRQYTYVYPISGRATARHVVMMTRTHTGREQGAKLHVISGETAEAVVEENLPKAFYSGRYQHLLQQRAEPVVTVEGNIIVPTGKGLRCYGPAGAGQGEKKEAAE